MDPTEASDAQGYHGNGGTPRRETPKASGQAIPRRENATTDKRSLEMEVSTSKGEEKRKVEEMSSELDVEGGETALAENPQAENSAMFIMLGRRQWMLGDLMETRSFHEDDIQARELMILGASAYERFKLTGDVEDVDMAIDHWSVAAALSKGSHTERWRILHDLGDAYMSRFERLGEISDLKNAVETRAESAFLIPDGHTDRPVTLNNLGISYTTRFDRLGELSDLSHAIEALEEAISLTPNGNPNKPAMLSNLGALYTTQSERLDKLSDLEKAIKSHEDAVLLTPNGQPDLAGRLDNLGISYTTRFKRLGKLSDLNKAIELQAEAVILTPDGDPEKPSRLNNLGATYSIRFKRLYELPDLSKAIEIQVEAVSLTPIGHPRMSGMLSNLGISYNTRFERLGELSDLGKAVESQAKAASLTPNGHPDMSRRFNNLANTYIARFERLGKLSDLSKAIESREEAVSLTPDGHPDKFAMLSNLGRAYDTRFERLGELSDLSKAIETHEEVISLTPDGHPGKPTALSRLGMSYSTRFERLGELPDLDKAIELEAESVSLTPNDHPGMPRGLSNLGMAYTNRFQRLGELSDLTKAIECNEKAVLLAPDDQLKPAALTNLAISYRARFKRLGELPDLSRVIDSHEKAVSLTPDNHPDKGKWLSNLAVSYIIRFERLNELSDLRSAAELFRTISQLSTAPPSVRFEACRRWATLSLFDSMPSPIPAYQLGMSLIPQLVWVGTTIDRRYELVAEVSSFATEAASYAISTGTYDLALEWLEAGRSIVWGQVAQLRTPFEDLSGRHPKLAEDLARVGRQLENAGSRSSVPSLSNTGSHDLVQEANAHVQLALEWDKLLDKIRSMPVFKDFLCAPTAGQLLSASIAHPIAMINLHKSRCDALILKPDSDTISHVALPDFSFEDALSARSFVFSQVRDRKIGKRLTASRPNQSSLEHIWSGIVKPVLDSLGYTHKLPIEQLPRITWCTTGLLSFLPLHTARSRDEARLSTFDLVISSYTPTLSALLSSQPVHPSSTCGMLAVGQENTSGLNSLPCTTEELAVIHKHASANYYLQLEGDEATTEQVLDAMDQFSWVHMACHGSQNPFDPTKSAFHLHDGDLTLADITKRSFTNKGLAFLSACQTATGDESMPDEAVHLAAGMLMAGYPSVIGTMWSIADEDGPKVADLVYAELLKGGKMDHTNAARALHRAVAQLRADVGEERIERWAPFIHIGI